MKIQRLLHRLFILFAVLLFIYILLLVNVVIGVIMVKLLKCIMQFPCRNSEVVDIVMPVPLC